MPLQGRVQVQLLKLDAPVVDDLRRKDLHPQSQGLRLGAGVRLDVPQHHLRAGRRLRPGRLQHGVGLAHAGRVAEEDLQLPAPLRLGLLAELLQHFVGMWPLWLHASHWA